MLSGRAAGKSSRGQRMQRTIGDCEVCTEEVLSCVWFVGAFWRGVRLTMYSCMLVQRVNAPISAPVGAFAEAGEVAYSLVLLSYFLQDLGRALRPSTT